MMARCGEWSGEVGKGGGSNVASFVLAPKDSFASVLDEGKG